MSNEKSSEKNLFKTTLVKPKFGSLLRKIRQKNGMSVRGLARELGVNHTYISQIELGKTGAPVGDVSMEIARILNSPELTKVAEYITVRELLILEMQRNAVYQKLPHELRNELDITDAELKEIADLCSKLVGKLLPALDRRQDLAKWKRISHKKGISERWVMRLK